VQRLRAVRAVLRRGRDKIIDGKARLVADRYCDGLGACLGECPMDAIQIVERDADEFDETAVEQHLAKQAPTEARSAPHPHAAMHGGGCPGMQAMSFKRPAQAQAALAQAQAALLDVQPSRLAQWPVQLHLLNPAAPYFQDSDLLIAADCVAFAMGDFHSRLLDGHSVAIACPKLDDTSSYVRRLAAIFAQNDIRTVTVAIMEVPCCRGLLSLVQQAMQASGKSIPTRVKMISLQGEVKAEESLADIA